MKRLFRHLFTLCAAASLLLCVVVCALWVRSYWRADMVSLNGAIDASGEELMFPFYAFSSLGSVEVYWNVPDEETWQSGVLVRKVQDARRSALRANAPWWERLGFSYRDMSNSGLLGIGGVRITFPYFASAFGFAILPAIWMYRARAKWERARAGFCPICRYDLRASPDRCPECGAVVGSP